MLIILSPAKTMDMTEKTVKIQPTTPLFEQDAESLAKVMRQYSVEELEKLLKISETLAKENYQRYQHFDAPDNPAVPAILAYNGSVFKSMNPSAFSEPDFSYAQDHLRIISTMYGIVRPLDKIKAYRIAYPLKLKGMGGKSLYDYWQPKLTAPLIKDVRKAGGILVNLASLDVLGSLNMEMLKQEVKVITPEFQEERDGKYETIRTYAKLARGVMTRYILTNRIEKPEQLKEFEWERFRFNEKISESDKFIFTRKKVDK